MTYECSGGVHACGTQHCGGGEVGDGKAPETGHDKDGLLKGSR